MRVKQQADNVAEIMDNMSEMVIRRRFAAGWRNFQQKYKLLVDAWALYDNSSDRPVLLEQATNV